ncbi:hypothetical protein H310_08611 [Aphanomyces invadans]|uniref:Nucleoporin protein Ndc1-Nup n=1 Tax=Aphanomyces invadans TaxID=157072 RepID=A0A024TWE9_9STRA|nr:hypothetical protein H310_08611 [Aphanomyces invadans]ETV98470.1 hypothetical protein H310_08611 [Aphanomyces invadans]|eukprot:XP_008872667.1 hypothetical protein H310_08611 [Aphanomyces invadans]
MMASAATPSRVVHRIRSCGSGVVSTSFLSICATTTFGSCLRWLLSTPVPDETGAFANALEWTLVVVAQTLLVVCSLVVVLYLLLFLPQQVPSRSSSIRFSVALRVCRLETIALVATLGLTSFVWNALFRYFVSKELHLSTDHATVFVQAILLATFVVFAPHHLLAHRPIVSDPVVSLLSSIPLILVRTAQSSAVATLGILYGAEDRAPFALVTLIASSSTLFFVYFTTAKAFSCLFLRTAYSWEGASVPPIAWLDLQHPAVSCTECTQQLPASPTSQAQPLTPSVLSSLRTNPSATYISFLEARSSCHSAPRGSIHPHLVPSTRSLEFWDLWFQAADLHLAAASGQSAALFASEDVWLRVFQVTTATIDGFACMWRALGKQSAPSSSSKDRVNWTKLGAVTWQIATSVQPSPSTLLQLISTSPAVLAFVATGGSQAAPSPWIWLEKWLANSLWHFTLATILLTSKTVVHCIDAVATAVCTSFAKDKQGIVQVTLPAIVYSLAACRVAIDGHRATQYEEYEAIVYALDSALQKITAVFGHAMPELTQRFPPALASTVQSYLACK